MNDTNKTNFKHKHGADAKPDPKIEAAIVSHTDTGQISCAVAFEIARNLGVTPADVGVTIDLIEHRITKCQLGLFGYKPNKKIITPIEKINPEMADAISSRTHNDRLSCKAAWEIAAQFKVSKMNVSSTCEAMQVRIKPCQLGAF